ncbi:MAG TPA: NAD(P)-binding domain-containing protein [Blastocatellia bacterium]|nr:NAD(P)-binding domain-containing protein [Blastocatellia bacterium]
MSAKSNFIIKRKDKDRGVDDVALESEGLTIGRLIGNDLVLNHRAVSRTHAGIKEINGEFWLFNLSNSNGTVLNGELVEKSPLSEGDIIQIGPYVLAASRLGNALAITVERELELHALGLTPSKVLPVDDGSGATVLVRMPVASAKKRAGVPPTGRLPGRGLLNTALPSIDQQALDVFWEKRRREAGKINARTPLHPKENQRVGKAQWNWRPTLDLKRLWRKSYFAWGVIAVAAASLGALYLFDEAYSPGPLSAAHSASAQSGAAPPARNVALQPNGGSCSSCHGITSLMQNKCGDCHTTQAFRPAIYDAHEREGMGCTACHTEHEGTDSEMGLMSYGLCANCHNGSYEIKTGERAGSPLAIPHGGVTGYPKANGTWQWKLSAEQVKRKGLPGYVATLSPHDQFHGVHQLGRMKDRMTCKDCHSGTRGSAIYRDSPRDECAKCHGVASVSEGRVERVQANCNGCHQQHGQSEDLAKFLASAEDDERKLKAYFTTLGAGGPGEDSDRLATARVFAGVGEAGRIRQDRDAPAGGFISGMGALSWRVWLALVGAPILFGLAAVFAGTVRRRSLFKTVRPRAEHDGQAESSGMLGSRSLDLDKLKEVGPAYPHPVIDPVLCIGCHACVEVCPHDVLAIVNGIATSVAIDQCMEDTSCQVECPTNPKACIVINTTKVIQPRKVPARDQRFMTNVDGIYLIGDVSGVPLIKNAVNEGAQVVDHIIESFRGEASGEADYDVAVIGAGPAGLSAAVIARQRGLKYILVEQDRVVSTIEAYPAGKYIYFKPDTMDARGGLPLAGAGDKKEQILESWMRTMKSNGIAIHDQESCKDIKREQGFFRVVTEKGKLKDTSAYKARAVILAIGNRGTPMKLRVPGEELTIKLQPGLVKHCVKCGAARQGAQVRCAACGSQFPETLTASYQDSKVKYRLTDPDDYSGRKCVVVGAGNSAVEAAVDLCGLRRDGDGMTFTRDNEVTLVVRSDFKADLKLGNKMNVYDCMDKGRIKVYFRAEIKEIKEGEVVLKDVKTGEEKARIPNDYVFALIGGEKPTKFLESLGVKIS